MGYCEDSKRPYWILCLPSPSNACGSPACERIPDQGQAAALPDESSPPGGMRLRKQDDHRSGPRALSPVPAADFLPCETDQVTASARERVCLPLVLPEYFLPDKDGRHAFPVLS